ncbi:hypothetical protein [Rhodopirellula halodulae]|uniref:hypothetical protein n=1 Tax=Rhodopirellula halodulae TaxID=2894198 RepID=UPI001E5108A2|nr:hypothetical protein [Rhodopirellula sp. JC737]MCC9656955.1 hypothetical protein [Rhodopirellula sp. JC737]
MTFASRMVIACLTLFLFMVDAAATSCVAQVQIDLRQFDSWMFQSHGRDETQCRKSLLEKIELEFVRIEQSAPLSEEQKEALRLAGRGDVKRFFDRVNEARREFMQMDGKNQQAFVNEAYMLAQPLQQELSEGLFGNDSLLHKVKKGVMTREQTKEMNAQIKLEAIEAWKVRVRLFAATTGRGLALTAKQQERFSDLVIAQIEPHASADLSRQHADMLINYGVFKCESKSWEAFLDDDQIAAVQTLSRRGQGYERQLQRDGVIQ